MVLKTCRPSGTWAMPKCARRAGGIASSDSPWNSMRPANAGTTPLIALNSVDLPAPFGPTTVTNFPSLTDSDTSNSARRPP